MVAADASRTREVSIEIGAATAAADRLHQRAGRVVALGDQIAVVRRLDVAAAVVGAGDAAEATFDGHVVGLPAVSFNAEIEVVGSAATADACTALAAPLLPATPNVPV